MSSTAGDLTVPDLSSDHDFTIVDGGKKSPARPTTTSMVFEPGPPSSRPRSSPPAHPPRSPPIAHLQPALSTICAPAILPCPPSYPSRLVLLQRRRPRPRCTRCSPIHPGPHCTRSASQPLPPPRRRQSTSMLLLDCQTARYLWHRPVQHVDQLINQLRLITR